VTPISESSTACKRECGSPVSTSDDEVANVIGQKLCDPMHEVHEFIRRPSGTRNRVVVETPSSRFFSPWSAERSRRFPHIGGGRPDASCARRDASSVQWHAIAGIDRVALFQLSEIAGVERAPLRLPVGSLGIFIGPGPLPVHSQPLKSAIRPRYASRYSRSASVSSIRSRTAPNHDGPARDGPEES